MWTKNKPIAHASFLLASLRVMRSNSVTGSSPSALARDMNSITSTRRCPRSISDMERGTRNPTLKAVERVAAALGVKPEELVKL